MILDQARELGLALSECEEFVRMAKASAAIEENEAVTSMIGEFREKQEQIMTLLQSEDADKSEMVTLTSDVETLQNQLMENPPFCEAIEAQTAFQTLMRRVNEEIGACIGGPSPNGEEGCPSSGCSGCSGCH